MKDALACLLFNTGLEKALLLTSTTDTILNKTVRILGCADDLDIFGRPQTTAEQAFP